jgi:primary-amine oxidase
MSIANFAAAALAAGLAWASQDTAWAQTYTCPTLGPVSGNTITQEFPAGGPGGMFKPAWMVSFGFATAKGLYITGAWFRKKPTDPWMQVIYDARLSDIFVPYHSGSPRYYDLSTFSFNLVNATAADAGPCGRVLGGKVVNQLRTNALLWKADTDVRYANELVLWATLGAANYNYVMSYGFRDDGQISLRIGATSHNLPSVPMESHMHDGLWRIDMDLNGAPNDSAYWMVHTEPSGSPLQASDTMAAFNGGVEGSAVWDALKFNYVLIQDQLLVNGRGHKVSYEFMPVRMGRAVHDELFSKADFWVTRYHPGEDMYKNVTTYVNGESVMNTDDVIWHMSPLHHEPRDEDGFIDNGYWNGVAMVMWGGLDLMPRNLWDRSPLYPNN